MNPASLQVAFPRRATTVLVILASVGVATAIAARPAIDSAAAWALLGLLPAGAAAWFDTRVGRLPDPLVAATAFVPVLIVLLEGAHVPDALTLFAGALAMSGPLLLLHLASPALIGFGDVKLAASLGLLIGLVDVRLATWALAVASGSTLLLSLGRRPAAVPFGPGLVTGAAVVLLARLFRSEIPR
jgi:leader peptidase (prepilin peptidase) / N-methyltransferase